jgi:hypothetical protein
MLWESGLRDPPTLHLFIVYILTFFACLWCLPLVPREVARGMQEHDWEALEARITSYPLRCGIKMPLVPPLHTSTGTSSHALRY